jgi:hypothetical protein
MYSCPYCVNIPMFISDLSRQFTNYANDEDRDKIAMVGPYVFDIIWDQVILFTKKEKP